MIVSRHAEQRIRKRFGIPKRACSVWAARAMEEGHEHSTTRGRLCRYLSKLHFKGGGFSKAVVYGDAVLLLRGETLITVLRLPYGIARLAKVQTDTDSDVALSQREEEGRG